MAVLGGGEIALANLVEHLDRERWQPLVLLGGDGPLVGRLRALGVDVEVLPFAPALTRLRQDGIRATSMVNPRRTVDAVRYVLRLRRRLKTANTAVVHANSLRACVLAGITGKLAGVPVVWQMHSVVATPMMTPAAVRMMRRLARFVPDRIICNSKATAASFRGVDRKVRIIACGSAVSSASGNGRRPGASRVGMIARFSPLKGQHVFVEAAKQVSIDRPETEFVFAGTPLFGENAYADEVRQESRTAANPDRFRFLGFVDDVPSLLRDLDIVVQPSVHPEGFGQSVLEAMMAGKPVVASAAGGLNELVEDGVSGRLVPPNDSGALSRAIGELLADPAAAAQMGKRGQERACELYDIRSTVLDVERVYAEVARA